MVILKGPIGEGNRGEGLEKGGVPWEAGGG